MTELGGIFLSLVALWMLWNLALLVMWTMASLVHAFALLLAWLVLVFSGEGE